MNKKAQSMSLNTVVVALIALIVLVILIAIVGGRVKVFNTESNSCEQVGGVCATSDNGFSNKECTSKTGNIKHPSAKCSPAEVECCIALIKDPDIDTSGANSGSNANPPAVGT